jgi:hypothetical protein
MAPQNPAHPEPKATADPMRANSLLDIIGACGRIAATALYAEHDLQWRENNAIRMDEKDDNRLHEPFSMAKFLKKATRDHINQPFR